jgi:hypothetical protein
MKWLLSDIEKENQGTGEEYVDILSQMPVTDRRHQTVQFTPDRHQEDSPLEVTPRH